LSESLIDLNLLKAYRETHYKVFAVPPFVLQIEQASEALAELYRQRKVSNCAFITAWNPFSQRIDAAENVKRNSELKLELARRDLHFINGIGQHPSNLWPGEPSYLILGIGLDESKALGIKLEQNAIVWAGADAVPRLVLLR
jgi:hypothetical protein